MVHTEDEQVELLQTWFDYEAQTADLFYQILQDQSLKSGGLTQNDFNKLLGSFQQGSYREAIGYIGFNQCIKGICHGISLPSISNEQLLKSIPLEEMLKKETSMTVCYIPSIGYSLLQFRVFKDPINGQVNAAIYSLFKLETILKRLSLIMSHYNESISILDEHFNILVSTNKTYPAKNFTFTKPTSFKDLNIINAKGVSFVTGDELHYGVLESFAPAKIWIMLDVPKATVLKVWKSYLQKMVVMFSMILIIGGIATAFVTSRIAKPLKNLLMMMRKVASGKLDSRYAPDSMGFEINHLGKQFNTMLEDLDKHIKKVEAEKIKKELYIKELAIGQQAQRSILPTHVPEIADFDIGVGFLAAQEVGGDFYDLFLNQNNQLFFCIADTAGKGIHACIYSLLVRSMLRSFFDAGNSLQNIIAKTNELFMKDTGMSGVFVTAWIGVLDIPTKRIRYSSCGHLPALVYNSETAQFTKLQTDGMALGVNEFTPTIQEYHLKEKDMLCLYTDGVIEAQTNQNAMFGMERLEDVLEKTRTKTAKQIIIEIEYAIREFAGGKAQHDDITLLVLRSLRE